MAPHSVLLSQLYRLTSPPPSDAELLHRWVERREEDAFTALVSRHGRMVHGVCRRILGNNHDADDVFQAVFLTLARKAAGLRRAEALPGWLHGVAVRLACKARAASRRRRESTEPSAAEPRDPHPDPLDALSARELLGLIDREIARLPDAYRLPLVLCDLEERTQVEAARLLGWSLGSLRGRLFRGREQLRTRLARRGIAPAVLAAMNVQGTADATALTVSISRLAVRFAVCPASAEISPTVATLVREGIGGMMLTKLKLVSVVLLAAGTLVVGAGLWVWPAAAPQPAEERTQDKPPSPPASAKSQVRRDRAGDPLPPEAISRLGTIRLRHGGMIRFLVFTPDGKTLVSKGFDGLRIWETATGKQIQQVPNGSVGTDSIDISPDGKRVAVLLPGGEGYVGLMEIATGQIVQRFGKRQVHALCFAPDGKMLVALGYDSEIEIWDPATGRALGTLKGDQKEVMSVAFSTDGKTLVSAGDDQTIRFWDIAARKQLRQITTQNDLDKIALSPDGRILASLGHIKHEFQKGTCYFLSEPVIRLWDAHTGKELRRLTMPPNKAGPDMTNGFSDLRFTRDGKTLVTGGYDGMVRIWEPETGREVRQFSGFRGGPVTFALHPEGKTLAVVSAGSTISLIRMDTGADLLGLEGHRAGIGSVLLRTDANVAVTAGWDRLLHFWDARTGKAQRDIASGSQEVIQILPGGRTYLAEGNDKKLHVCDLDTGKEVRVLQGWNGRSFWFRLSPDGHVLAQADAAGKNVSLLDPATGKRLHDLTGFKQQLMGMSFSPDGQSLFLWSLDKTVTVWDPATGEKRRQFAGPTKLKERPHPAGTSSYESFMATLSPDGKLLAYGLQSDGREPGVLPILDTTTGKEIRRFSTSADGVSHLEFAPDGKSVAWGGWREGTVYLGEIATGRERHRFTGHRGRIFSLAFSADGQKLISGSEDTSALIWDLSGRLSLGSKFGAPLSAADLATQWKALGSEDAAIGYRAIQVLAADPVRSIASLRTRLHPIAPVDEKRVRQWIADLDSDQFAVREKATMELGKVGTDALPAMRKALEERPALETRRRLEPLIEKLVREEWAPSPDGLRSRRSLEVLERVGTTEAKDVLTALAKGAPGAWQTLDAKAALKRLEKRFPAKR